MYKTTTCQRNFDPFPKLSYFIKWVKTSCTTVCRYVLRFMKKRIIIGRLYLASRQSEQVFCRLHVKSALNTMAEWLDMFSCFMLTRWYSYIVFLRTTINRFNYSIGQKFSIKSNFKQPKCRYFLHTIYVINVASL